MERQREKKTCCPTDLQINELQPNKKNKEVCAFCFAAATSTCTNKTDYQTAGGQLEDC